MVPNKTFLVPKKQCLVAKQQFVVRRKQVFGTKNWFVNTNDVLFTTKVFGLVRKQNSQTILSYNLLKTIQKQIKQNKVQTIKRLLKLVTAY